MNRYTRSARPILVVAAILLGAIAQNPGGSTAQQLVGPDRGQLVPKARGKVFVVTNAEDDGVGSLRRTIADANDTPNHAGLPDRIVFDLAESVPHSIRIYSALPEITDPVVIDGPIELDGSWMKEADGIVVRCGGSTIRGLSLQGFPGDAIRIVGRGGNVVEGNRIAGNGGHGVAIVGSSGNRIGGAASDSQNEIDANGLSGVFISGEASVANAILGNRIHDNAARGIELDGDVALDAGDVDSGPNRLQNAPTLETVTRLEGNPGDGTSARIAGTIASAPNTTFHLEFFSTIVTSPDVKPKRQGAEPLTTTDITTNEGGQASFQVTLPEGVASRALVTATATDPEGNTSEFSDAVLAPAVTKSWAAAVSGGWNTPANWSPPGVPAATDDAVITIAGTYTVTLDVTATVASLTLGGASGTQTLVANANTLTLSGASTVNANGVLSQGGATIGGAGALTIDGTYNWSGGLLTGTGLTTVNGPLNVSGLVAINGGRTLNNAGTATWTSAAGLGIRTGTGSIINNTGTWDAKTGSGAAIVNFYGGASNFNNSGTFKKTADTATTSITVPFANTGTVDVQTGTLSFGANGSSTNVLNVSGAAATLLFAAGVFDLNAGTTITGPGTVLLNSSGTLNVNAAVSIPAATTFTFLAGTLGGTATLTTNGTFNWSGGLMTGAGATTVNGPFNLSGLTAINGGRTLNNASTAVWTSAAGLGIRTGSGSVINNSATWDAQTGNGAAIVNFYGGASTFNNSGTFKKSADTGTTSITVPFVNTGTVDVQTGTVSFGANGSSTNVLNVSGAAATLLFAAGVFDLNAGTTITGPGTVLLNSSGTLNVNAAVAIPAATTFTFLAGTLGGTATLTTNGTFNWSGGLMTGAGATTVNGPFNLSGLTAINGGRTLNNASTAVWTSAAGLGIRTGTGSVINNSGTWDAQTGNGAAIVNFYGGVSTFNNSGTFKKSADTGTTSITVPFVNTGTVDVQTGTVSFGANSSSTNVLKVSGAASTLLFAAGTFDLNAGTTITGPGTVTLNGSGTLNVNAAVAIPAGTTFTFLTGTLGGTATLTTNGTFNWSGGLMTGAGATTVNGAFNLSGLTAINGGRTLNNASTAVWTSPSGDGMWTGTGSIINNTGTWDSQTDNVYIVNHYGGATTFNNSGTFKKSAGTGITYMDIPFVNTGTVNVQTGTISTRGGGSSTNALNVSSAASTLLFAAGVFNLNAGTTFSGPGTVLLNSSGTLNANAAVAFPAGTTFTLLAGSLAGTGTITTNGTFNWSGGTMSGAAATHVNGPLNLSGLVGIFGSRVLNNNNLASWTSGASEGMWTGTGSVINNSGTWDASVDGGAIVNHYGGATNFNNSGTLKKSAGTGTTSISIPLTNTGTVDVQSGTLVVSNSTYTQTAGITKLTGGALTSTTNLAIQGGSLAGTGTVTAPVIVSGTGALAPGLSAGQLTLAGNYTQQGPNGAFNVELGGTTPGTQFDRADVSGAGGATLAGNLNVSFINAFTPAAGDSFTIMTYPTHTGSFTLNAPSVTCRAWDVNYGATSVVLTSFSLPTELRGLTMLPDKTNLQWSAAPAYAGTTYDLMRGELNTLPVGPGAGETCLAQGISGTTATDTDVPAAGHGFWYVVRERVASCGIGTYGFATGGAERVSTACP